MNFYLFLKKFFTITIVSLVAIVFLIAGTGIGKSVYALGWDTFNVPDLASSFTTTADTATTGLAAVSIPVDVTTSIPDKIADFSKIAADIVQAATYKSIMGLVRSFTAKMVGDTFDWVQKGFPGEGPAFYTTPWDQWMPNLFNDAGGYFVESLVDGFVQTQKEDEFTSRTNADFNTLMFDATQCQQGSNILKETCLAQDPPMDPCVPYESKLKECQAIQVKIDNLNNQINLFTEQQAAHRDNRRQDQQGAISPEAQQFMDSVVCKPSASLTLKIGLGLFPAAGAVTRQPVCKISEAYTNWSSLIQKTGTDIKSSNWSTLGSFFDPNSTDLGTAFNAQVAQYDYQLQASQQQVSQRQEASSEGGYKSVAETVSGTIKTPGSVVGNAVAKALDESAKPNQLTGNLFVDSLSVVLESLTDTLYGKLTDTFKKGIVTAKAWSLYGSDYFSFKGVQAAQRGVTKFESTVKFIQRDNIDVTSRLLSTETPGNPDAGTIGKDLAIVLQQRLTLHDAIEKGYIKKNATFGFDFNDKEPSAKDGNLPYRSLVILRKYRVVPVTWEFAALYIHNKKGDACGTGKSCTIEDMIDAFDRVDASGNPTSPFYGLVDQNWVLKLPPTRCELEGYGPTNIVSTVNRECKFDTNGDGVVDCSGNETTGSNLPDFDVPVPQVSRDETCVDEQSCLETDSSGNCVQGKYGYCIQEKQTWNFKAESCEPQYTSCRVFTNQGTGSTLSVLTKSISTFTGGSCDAQAAGCHWLSSVKNANTNIPWSSDDSAKEYLNAQAETIACDASGEGCEAVTNTTRPNGQEYYKIAPESLHCSFADKGFEKPACEPYATQCLAIHENCELYTSATDNTSMAGKHPLGINECNASCVGLGVYNQAATQFDPLVFDVPFIAEKAQQCSAADVGCEEFTNLSNETKVYYKDVQSCEKTPAEPETPTPFYSWYGSDTTGFKLAVINIKPNASGDPACGNDPATGQPYQCECSKGIFDAQRANPLTTGFACREYINKAGAVSYRYSSKVVYQTDDCSQMRRSANDAPYNFSPSHSISCTPQAAGCRLFEGTKSGNTATVLVTDFEDGTLNDWTTNSGSGISPSTEAPFLNGKSLKIVGSGAQRITHPITLHNGYTYVVSFDIIGSGAGSVSAGFEYGSPSTVLSMGDNATTGDWKQVTFSLPKTNLPSDNADATLVINAPSGTTYIDNVVVREAQGIVYAIANKLNVGACQAVISPDGATLEEKAAALGSQLNCKLYTDTAGKTQILKGVEQLCPLAVVGCNAFHVIPAKTGVAAYDTYFVADPAKKCDASQQSCSAYGLPTMDPKTGHTKISYEGASIPSVSNTCAAGYVIAPDTKCYPRSREVWTTEYYKIKDKATDKATAGASCTPEQQDCQDFTDGSGGSEGSHRYFKDPLNRVCVWMTGTDQASSGWVDKDTKEPCGPDTTIKHDLPAGYAGLCPETEDYCRQVTDPECVTTHNNVTNTDNNNLRSNYGSGVTGEGNFCTPKYYIKDNPKEFEDASAEACRGQVNPAIGCLLFSDSNKNGGVNTYDSVAHYDRYAATQQKPVDSSPALTPSSTGKDANVLYKVDLDRQCKTWLACTSSVRVSDGGSGKGPQDICLQRKPCDKWGNTDEPCQNFVPEADPRYPVNPLVYGLYHNDAHDTAIARTLSGIARPNFTFNPILGELPFTVFGGHDSTFSWNQVLENPDPLKDNRPTASLTGPMGGVADFSLLNSCRLYPKEDAPVADGQMMYWNYVDENGKTIEPKVPVDACYYKDQNLNRQQGLYGYCLEPYPQYYDSGVMGGQYSATKNVNAGYQNYCLNWYPTGYISGQSSVLGGGHPMSAYSGVKPLYYCTQSTGGKKGFDSNTPASTEIMTEYAVKTRDTSIFRFAKFGAEMQLRDTSGVISLYNENVAEAATAQFEVRNFSGGHELEIPTYPTSSTLSNQVALIFTFPENKDAQYAHTLTCNVDTSMKEGIENTLGIDLYLETSTTSYRAINNVPYYTCPAKSDCPIKPEAHQQILFLAGTTKTANPSITTGTATLPVTCTVGGAHITTPGLEVPIRLIPSAPANSVENSAVITVTDQATGQSAILKNTTSSSTPGVMTVGKLYPMYFNNYSLSPGSWFDDDAHRHGGIMKIDISNVPPGTRVSCDLQDRSSSTDARTDLFNALGLDWWFLVPDNSRMPSIEASYRGNFQYEGKSAIDYGLFSALTDLFGHVTFKVVNLSLPSTPSGRHKITPLYCSFGETPYHEFQDWSPDYRVHKIMRTEYFDVQTVSQSIAQNSTGLLSSAIARAQGKIHTFVNGLAQVKSSLLETIASSLTTYRIAGLAPTGDYQVIKPAITVSSPAINFTLEEAQAGTLKSVVVSSDPIPRPNIDQFAWRAVVDASKTPRVSIQGGYTSSLFSITKDHGNSGDSVEVSMRKDILGDLAPGTYRGAVKVYAVAPIEGTSDAATELSLPVILTIPTERTSSPISIGTIPLEYSPTASTVQDTFAAAVTYDDIDPAINSGRLVVPVTNPPALKDATSPVYASNTEITLHLRAFESMSSLCQTAGTAIQARLIYSYIGEGIWHAMPSAEYTGTGEVKRVFKQGNCSDILFKFDKENTQLSGVGGGIQYYFVIENVNKNISARSEVFYIDVKNPAELSGNMTEQERLDALEADKTNPIGSRLRDAAYGIGDTKYVANGIAQGALRLSSLKTKDERLLAYKNYHYANTYCTTNSSDKGSSQSCDTTETRTSYDYGIKEVTSSNDPTQYCGEGKPCETIKWLAPKEETNNTSGPRTRIVEKGPDTGDDILKELRLNTGQESDSVTNPVYVETETLNPEEINRKFLITDTQYTPQAYQGKVKVIVKKVHTYQFTSHSYDSWPNEGTGSHTYSSNSKTCDTTSCEIRDCTDYNSCKDSTQSSNLDPQGFTRDVSATLVVRPTMVLPDTIDLAPADVGTARSVLVDSNPKTTVYNWRAYITKQDPILRRDNGQFNWLTLSPTAGMSGTSFSVSLSPEAVSFAIPGATYNAEITINATSPVEGNTSRIVKVVFKAPSAKEVVNIANVGSGGGSYTLPSSSFSIPELAGENSVMVLFSKTADTADTRRTAIANDFERVINKDDIAQINYTIEHRTRATLPGTNWASTDIQGASLESTNGGITNLVCTRSLTSNSWWDFVPIVGAIRHLGDYFQGCEGPDSTLSPLLSASQVTDSYPDYVDALPNITRPVIATTEKTNMYTMVLNSANSQDVTPENAFGAQCHGRKDSDIGRDFAVIAPNFDSNGNILSWNTRYCDDSGGSSGDIGEGQNKYVFVTITIYLKDYCTNIVQVVKDDGTSVPWRQKVIDAEKDAAGAPLINDFNSSSKFMSLIPPVGRPEKWGKIPIINENNSAVAHAQALTVAAVDPAVGSICLGGPKTGAKCTTSNDCVGGGKCFGSTASPDNVDSALNWLKQDFAKGYKWWQWNPKGQHYVEKTGPDTLAYERPLVYCEGDFGTGSCLISPKIQSIDTNKVRQNNIALSTHPNGKTVELNFNSIIDEQQKPLTEIKIEWGDGLGAQVLRYTEDDRPIVGDAPPYSQPRGEHHFSHTYNDTAIGKEVCVTVWDNWGAGNRTCAIAP